MVELGLGLRGRRQDIVAAIPEDSTVFEMEQQ